jgi:hypothetical protein
MEALQAQATALEKQVGGRWGLLLLLALFLFDARLAGR